MKKPVVRLMVAAVAASIGLSLVPSSPTLAAAAGTDSESSSRVVVRASGLPWSSGVTPEQGEGSEAKKFGRERGAPVDNIVVFPGRQTWTTLLSRYWYQAVPNTFVPHRDDLVVSVPLWPASNSIDNTGSHAQWVRLGRNIDAVDPNAYLRLAWEMNIFAPWAITKENRTQWISQFRRSVRLLRIGCPDCQIVWNPNHGPDQTGTSSRSAFKSLANLISVYAIDSYDIYPPIKDAASRRLHMNQRGSMNDSYRFAVNNHKLFAVPEWGIACNSKNCGWHTHAGGDNPLFINTYVDWFAAHAGHLAFESYFDSTDPRTRAALYTDPIGPKSGRAYRQDLARYRR